MAEGFRFMPLGLVRLRTFWLSTWLRCKLDAGVTRMRGGRVTQRCDNSPHWKWGYGVRVTSRTGSARRILGISKKVEVLKLDAERGGWLLRPRRGQTNLRATGQMKKPTQKDCVSLLMAMTSRTGSARRILGISKKVEVLKLDAERGGWLLRPRPSQTNLRATGQMKKPTQKDCVSLLMSKNL